MKALTLWQPWATLAGSGIKQIETRSWATSYRGVLAIHAAKVERPEEAAVVALSGFYDALWPLLGFSTRPMPASIRARLPRGAVVAVSRLVDCLPVIVANDPYEPDTDFCMVRSLDGNRLYHKVGNTVADMTDQLPYGDFSPGRWAWMLTGITQMDEPIPVRGRQGLWNWPEGVKSPVLYQGQRIIGYANTERAAIAVHVRALGRPPYYERVSARLTEWIDEGALLSAHKRGEDYIGPLAWFVGRQLWATH